MNFPHHSQVFSPAGNAVVVPPVLVISGRARGPWYFEATFSAELIDANGERLANTFIMTSDNWMTEDFVSFSKDWELPENIAEHAPTDTGWLVLHKANASGLPEHDDFIRVPVRLR